MANGFATAAVAIILVSGAQGQSSPKLVSVPGPPMGWSSWNSFSNTVNAQNVMEQAKAMATNGMKKAGYQYIMGNIVRFIHGLGLKAGIYTDAGRDGCSMYPDLGPKIFGAGSEGHYEQDFLQFAKWGFDYVKVDWCGGDKENLDPAVQYAEIARAIAKAEVQTGHRLYLSLCEWGKQSPWMWAPHVGGLPADVWRTSGDIVDPIVATGEHKDRKASFAKMLGNFDQGIHPEGQHTGFYNDPDMMVIGMPGLTDLQNRAHMSLWAISGAPLLVGADLTTLTAETLNLLTKADVLAVDQDPLGLQAVKVAEPAKGLEVWAKPLAAAGSRAVLLLNRTGEPAEITVQWKDLGMAETTAKVKNLWTGEELPSYGTYTVKVPATDAVLVRVQGTEAASTQYKPEGQSHAACRGCDVRFMGVRGHSGWARVRIVYANPDKTARYAELRVNGNGATAIAFPSTGAAAGAVEIQTRLDHTDDGNVLVFSADHDADHDTMPRIESVLVHYGNS